jgi:copper chaperone CopZ
MAMTEAKVQGMHCVDCAHKVEAAIREVPGVASVRVHYLKKQAYIESTPEVDWDKVQEAVKAAGYELILPGASPS